MGNEAALNGNGEYDEHGNYIPPPDNSVYRTGNNKETI